MLVQELSTLQDVTVTLEQGDSFCSTAGSVTKIEFTLPQGDVPDLVLTQSTTFDATIALFTGGAASTLLVGTALSKSVYLCVTYTLRTRQVDQLIVLISIIVRIP